MATPITAQENIRLDYRWTGQTKRQKENIQSYKTNDKWLNVDTTACT